MKKQRINRAIYCLFVVLMALGTMSGIAFGQVTEGWVRQFQSSDLGCVPDALAVDKAGNSYVVGITNVSQADVRLMLLKYNPSGVPDWIQSFDKGFRSVGNAVVVDSQGDVYVGGFNDTAQGNQGLIVKYDADGNLVWSTSIAAPFGGSSAFSELALDDQGNVYGTGSAFSQVTSDDAWTVKCNSSGQVLWQATFDSGPVGQNAEHDEGIHLRIDAAHNVYVACNTFFDYSASLIKYDSSGQLQWSTTTAARTTDNGHPSVELGPNSTVYFSTTNKFDGLRAFRYLANGTIVFSKPIGPVGSFTASSNVDPEGRLIIAATSSNQLRIIKLDLSGNAFFDYSDSKSTNPLSVSVDGDNTYTSGVDRASGLRCVTQKIDPTGHQLWTETFPVNPIDSNIPFSTQVSHSGMVVTECVTNATSLAETIAYFEDPVAINDQYGATKNAALAVPTANGVMANDIYAGNGSAIEVSGPTNGTLSLNSDGSFSYQPDAGFVGTDSFTYKIAHGIGRSNVATVTISVAPALSSLVLNPNQVMGGDPTTGTVTLESAAPSGGVVVALSSGSSVVIPPATVTVLSGTSSRNFTVNTAAVGSTVVRSVSASLNGVTKIANLTLTPLVTLTNLSVSPNPVIGGLNATGTVTTNVVAPAGGVVVNLSSGSSVIHVPATVTVAAGASAANFTVNTSLVATTVVRTITATFKASTKTANVTLLPASAIQSLSFNPTSVVGGNDSTGTVTLASAAPQGGETVTLSGGTASVSIPASVTVAASATSATFAAHTSPVAANAPTTITATFLSFTKSATLTVLPGQLVSLTFNPTTVQGGHPSTGTVTLGGKAPAGGAVITLSSGSSVIQVPASVTVAAGASSATFTANTLAVAQTFTRTVSASYLGVTKVASLTITP